MIDNGSTSNPLLQKPKSIVIARTMLYVLLLIIFISSLISEFVENEQTYSSIKGLTATILTLAFVVFIIVQIGLRKKWARALNLILFILGILILPFYITDLLTMNLIQGLLNIIELIVHGLSLVFLFNKDSNKWFDQIKIKVSE